MERDCSLVRWSSAPVTAILTLGSVLPFAMVFHDRWKQSGLWERIDGLLEEAAALHAALEHMEFTPALPQDFEYLGG